MSNHKILSAGALALCALCLAPAVNAEEAPFRRSSIYTVLINSADQNTRLDKEAQETDPEGYEEALKAAGVQSLGSIPASVFGNIVIPEQFNNHNLSLRIIDFDKMAAGITDAEAKEHNPKGKGGGFLKAAAGEAMGAASGKGESSIVRVEPVDEKMHAVMYKYITGNAVADSMVALWYNYNPTRTPQFNEDVILERGFGNASAEEMAKAQRSEELKAQLSSVGYDMMGNTFLIATNLRFRNNKAVADEISSMIGTAAAAAGSNFGGLGALAAAGAKKGSEALINGIMKDQFSVTAVTLLYKLDWNDDIDAQLGEKVLYKEGGATFADLVNSGLCKLTYVGQTKARAGVKKNKEKTLVELTQSATARAIDKALAKLQVENETFRTRVPISKCEDGFVYAKIGTKEGVTPGDEYEILEAQIDKNGRQVYKKVGSAKVEKGGVWFNTVGADELIAEADEKRLPKCVLLPNSVTPN